MADDNLMELIKMQIEDRSLIRKGGQMRKRGQKVTLKHADTGEVIKAKIILADSKQGYLAELIDKPYCGFLDAWKWYHPTQWEEVK